MPDWMRAAGAWPASPVTLLKEYTTALRTLLRGEPGPPNGRYVQCEGVQLTEVPEVAPPVILGVRGPKSQAAAGEVADGLLLAEPAAPAYIGTSRRHLRPEALVVTYDAAAVDTEEKAALDRVRPGLAAIGEPDWAAHLEPLPFAAELRAHREAAADGAEFARTLPDAWVHALAVVGTPEQARAAIAARHAAGATTVVLAPVGPSALDALDSLARALPEEPTGVSWLVRRGGPALRALGYWASPQAPELPDAAQLVDESWDEEERSLVAAYLDQGQLIRQYMGVSRCRLCGCSNGNAELTDGSYVWPGGLAHYVTEHAVRLPAEFVSRARRRLDDLEQAAPDFTWWNANANANVNAGRTRDGD